MLTSLPIFTYAGQAGTLCQMHKRFKSTVPVFGALVLDQNMEQVVLVRNFHNKFWTFPRGKLEIFPCLVHGTGGEEEDDEGETGPACAAREVKEETGLAVMMNTSIFQANDLCYIPLSGTAFDQITGCASGPALPTRQRVQAW